MLTSWISSLDAAITKAPLPNTDGGSLEAEAADGAGGAADPVYSPVPSSSTSYVPLSATNWPAVSPDIGPPGLMVPCLASYPCRHSTLCRQKLPALPL